MSFVKRIELEMAGLGFIFYSPFAASAINEGDDYLASNFDDAAEVERQAVACRIVGVGTGTPGVFLFDVLIGYPSRAGPL